MESREQFLKSVNHQQTDRIVMDLGATAVTGVHVQTISKLRHYLGLQRKPIRVIEPFQMLAGRRPSRSRICALVSSPIMR